MASPVSIARAIIFMIGMTLAGTLLAIVITLLAPILWFIDPQWHIPHHMCTIVTHWWTSAFINVRVVGLENLPANFKGCVIVSNHQSTLDMGILSSLWRHYFSVVFKRELLFYPGFGQALWLAGYLSVRRGDKASGQAVLAKCADVVRSGGNVLFFAEGTRHTDAASAPLGPFKPGAFKVAADTRALIVPVTISGARKLFPAKGMPSFGFGSPTLFIHAPIASTGKTVSQLMDETYAAIASNLTEADLPTARAPAGSASAQLASPTAASAQPTSDKKTD